MHHTSINLSICSFVSYRQRMIANQATKRDDAINYMGNRDQEENTAAAAGAAADEGAATADAAATSPNAMQPARNGYQPPEWKKPTWCFLAVCLVIGIVLVFWCSLTLLLCFGSI